MTKRQLAVSIKRMDWEKPKDKRKYGWSPASTMVSLHTKQQLLEIYNTLNEEATK